MILCICSTTNCIIIQLVSNTGVAT